MKNTNIKLIILLSLFTSLPGNAYAYLDPGTASIILQALVAILAGFVAFFTILKGKIMDVFKSIKVIFLKIVKNKKPSNK
tara:strand:+ start:6138 stop:6377 length:240 start_codon:yes stop_codon:yes gene_type:complete